MIWKLQLEFPTWLCHYPHSMPLPPPPVALSLKELSLIQLKTCITHCKWIFVKTGGWECGGIHHPLRFWNFEPKNWTECFFSSQLQLK
jgi:hypothetical protein